MFTQLKINKLIKVIHNTFIYYNQTFLRIMVYVLNKQYQKPNFFSRKSTTDPTISLDFIHKTKIHVVFYIFYIYAVPIP